MTRTATPALEVRHADLPGLVDLLAEQHSRRVDLVQPASAIRAEGGVIRLFGHDRHDITPNGVTTIPAMFTATDVFHEGIADKLRIPVQYVRRMAAEHPTPTSTDGWSATPRQARSTSCVPSPASTMAPASPALSCPTGIA